MSTQSFTPPSPANEPVLSYAPGTPERDALRLALTAAAGAPPEVMSRVRGADLATGHMFEVSAPHARGQTLAMVHGVDRGGVRAAIDAAIDAKADWARMPAGARAGIFLRAAELLAGPYRQEVNAATMLGQSKSVQQAEIDAACEMVDFLRFNVAYYADLVEGPPIVSDRGMWNRVEARPLEGFVLAVTPFNFTAIAGNLPTAPALCGNTVVWKPSEKQALSAAVLMRVLEAAGLPPGVVNLVHGDGALVAETVLDDRDFAGLHFTGSSRVFRSLWRTIGHNIDRYRSFPRIVGEAGGKDFVLVHRSADVPSVVTGLVRGAFEYQGQKCSAASRAYVPRSLWPSVKEQLIAVVESIVMGDVSDFSVFMGAVIDRSAFERLASWQSRALSDPTLTVVAGGGSDDSDGWFIEPTVVVSEDPGHEIMSTELFGPLLSVFVYEDSTWPDLLGLVDATSDFALTGAIFATDRAAIVEASVALDQAAGNFYINDKPTGAVVGQQPFGGARASGTNDKAGGPWNLARWISPRSVKETFVSPTEHRYPHMHTA